MAAHEPTEVTRGKVQSLAQFGIPQDQIAAAIGVSAPTLRKHYATELAAGKLAANRQVAQNLFAYASGAKGKGPQQVSAAIFWAKTQMGWTERVEVNHVADTDGLAAQLLAGIDKTLAALDTRESAEAGAVGGADTLRPH